MVLLKNDRNLLPLSKKGRVVLTGCMAQNRDSLMGAWTPDGSADSVITIEEGIRAVAPELELFTESCTLLSDMTAVMEQADTVILALGESAGLRESSTVWRIFLCPRIRRRWRFGPGGLGKRW